MRLANVRDLRNHYNRLLSWVEAGEEVLIEKRGNPVAMLIPSGSRKSTTVDWGESAALTRNKASWRKLSRKETFQLLNQFREER